MAQAAQAAPAGPGEPGARVSVTVAGGAAAGRRLLAPVGVTTPHRTPLRFDVEGAGLALTGETQTGQMAALMTPDSDGPVTLTYAYAAGGSGYPEAAFVHRPNRFTQADDALARDARRIAEQAGGGRAGIAAIVNDAARKFTYGHPHARFNDGLEAIPHLACGLTEGSCVDINTYTIAALRAAGFEAGYVTGYFFPDEKDGTCEDMHCWVVTRHDGVVAAWDIAHHLKLGTREVRSGLNPRPGTRVAIGHSMGLDFPELGIRAMKLLAEPVWVDGAGHVEKARVAIRLDAAGAQAADAQTADAQAAEAPAPDP